MCYIMVHIEGSNGKTGMLLRVCTLLRKDMDGKKNKEIMDLRYNIQLLVLGGAGEHPSCHEWEVGYTLYSWTVHHRTNADRPQLTATPTANLKTTRPDLGSVGGNAHREKIQTRQWLQCKEEICTQNLDDMSPLCYPLKALMSKQYIQITHWGDIDNLFLYLV